MKQKKARKEEIKKRWKMINRRKEERKAKTMKDKPIKLSSNRYIKKERNK